MLGTKDNQWEEYELVVKKKKSHCLRRVSCEECVTTRVRVCFNKKNARKTSNVHTDRPRCRPWKKESASATFLIFYVLVEGDDDAVTTNKEDPSKEERVLETLRTRCKWWYETWVHMCIYIRYTYVDTNTIKIKLPYCCLKRRIRSLRFVFFFPYDDIL